MEKRYAERQALWLWMLWKRKLFAQYWMRIWEHARQRPEKRTSENTNTEAFSTLQTNTHADGRTHTYKKTHAHLHIRTIIFILSRIDLVVKFTWCYLVLCVYAFNRILCSSVYVFVSVYVCTLYKRERHFNYNLNWNIIAAKLKRKVPLSFEQSIGTRVFLSSEIDKIMKKRFFLQTPTYNIYIYSFNISLKKYVVCQLHRHLAVEFNEFAMS